MWGKWTHSQSDDDDSPPQEQKENVSDLIQREAPWSGLSHVERHISNLSSSPSFILYSGWSPAVCQRSAVLLWPQLWSPTPHIWLNWSWVSTSFRIQEFLLCVVSWRVQTVDWRLCGAFTVSLLLWEMLCLMKNWSSSGWDWTSILML